jgi:Ca2+-binding EF-hand superfamily protein
MAAKEMRHAAEVAFQQFDTDGSRSISVDEFGLLLKQLRIDLTEDEVKELVAELDNDEDGDGGDGEIDFSEFMEFIDSRAAQGELDLSDPRQIEEFVDDIFTAIDADGDGNVTVGG